MGLINLFKTFTKGQENAQDQLNENFTKLEEKLNEGISMTRLTATSDARAGATITLNESIHGFKALAFTIGAAGNGELATILVVPWSIGTWRPDASGELDRFGLNSLTGKFVVTLRTDTTFYVEASPTTGSGIRYIDGIK